jgi:hypothetical protein
MASNEETTPTIGKAYSMERIEQFGLTMMSFEENGTVNYREKGNERTIYIFEPIENDLSNGRALEFVGTRKANYQLRTQKKNV